MIGFARLSCRLISFTPFTGPSNYRLSIGISEAATRIIAVSNLSTNSTIKAGITMTGEAHNVRLLSQKEAIELDQELFNECEFSVDQLMELAGLSAACAIQRIYRDIKFARPIVCCGPGNNGGDGLVLARHLKIFGYKPVVIYPKQTSTKLMKQCQKFDIPVLQEMPNDVAKCSKGDTRYNLIVDAIFGFSYKPPNRNKDFAKLLNQIHHMSKTNEVPIVSMDIPSGWNVETGPQDIDKDQADVAEELRLPKLEPDCLISLTAPKLCSAHFKGRFHYLGGRFCPPSIIDKYNLNLPTFDGTEQAHLLTTTVDLQHYW